MTRKEADAFLYSIAGDLGFIEIENYTCKDGEKMREAIKVLEQEPKTGRWVKISPADIFECSECGQNVMTDDICVYRYCHGCGAKMAESEGEHG